jgi:tetratricopeptide (TPR) repeat protein
MRLEPRYKRGDRIRGLSADYLVAQALLGGMGEVYLCLELEKMQSFALKKRRLITRRPSNSISNEALADLDHSIDLDPTLAVAYHNPISYDQRIYDPYPESSKLGALLKQHITVARDAALAYYDRGVEHASAQRYDEALADYIEAIKIDPTYAPAYVNRGCVYVDLQRYDEALADLTRAVQLDSKLAHAHLNLGVILLIHGEVPEALQCFESRLN